MFESIKNKIKISKIINSSFSTMSNLNKNLCKIIDSIYMKYPIVKNLIQIPSSSIFIFKCNHHYYLKVPLFKFLLILSSTRIQINSKTTRLCIRFLKISIFNRDLEKTIFNYESSFWLSAMEDDCN